MRQLSEVRGRIRSVAGIGDVCRTLSTVASARLSQTRERALGVRVYAQTLRTMVARQQRAAAVAGDSAALSPLLEAREVHKSLVLVVGADRGLCGGFNLAIGRCARAFAKRLARDGIDVAVVVKGRRAETYLRRATKLPIVSASGWTRRGVTDEEVDGLLDAVLKAFCGGEYDEVWACYTAFLSTVQHEPKVVRLLPVSPGSAAEKGPDRGWYYEPDRAACVAELLDVLVRLQIEDVLLESYASEQAARMVTMQEATERAERALSDLRVRYNRLRRESITSDLIGEIVASRMRGGGDGATR